MCEFTTLSPHLTYVPPATPASPPPPHLTSVPPTTPASPPPPNHANPLLALPQATSTREPQPFYTIPSTFRVKSLKRSTETCGKVRYKSIPIGTEHSPIQIPGDMQAASKIAVEKRKHHAIAIELHKQSKDKTQEMLKKISDLQAQGDKMIREIEHLRQKRDLLRDAIQQSRVPIPPLAPPPRQQNNASLLGMSALNGDGQGPAVHTSWVYDHYPSKHIQVLRQRTHSGGVFHINANPLDIITLY